MDLDAFEHAYIEHPDEPLPLEPPTLPAQVPGFIADDLRQMAFIEPDNYKTHCVTAEYSLRRCNRNEPILVWRSREEVRDGQEMTFCILAFPPPRPPEWVDMPVMVFHCILFGEIGISKALYERLVRQIGVRRPLSQEAPVPDEYDKSPDQLDDEHWAELLSGAPVADDEE